MELMFTYYGTSGSIGETDVILGLERKWLFLFALLFFLRCPFPGRAGGGRGGV